MCLWQKSQRAAVFFLPLAYLIWPWLRRWLLGLLLRFYFKLRIHSWSYSCLDWLPRSSFTQWALTCYYSLLFVWAVSNLASRNISEWSVTFRPVPLILWFFPCFLEQWTISGSFHTFPDLTISLGHLVSGTWDWNLETKTRKVGMLVAIGVSLLTGFPSGKN